MGFHAVGDRFGADVARDRNDVRAMSLLDPVIGTATDESAVGLHFDDRQIATGGERRTFCVDVADGDPDIALCELRADATYEGVIVDQVDAVDRDQESVLPGFLGRAFHHPVNELHVLQRNQRQGNGCTTGWLAPANWVESASARAITNR